jgi:hypothetical protein
MSPLLLRPLFFVRADRWRTDGSRLRRRCRPRLELLDDRITPTTVTGLSPNFGPAAGGTFVTITGTGFTGVTAVDFGTAPASNDFVLNSTLIRAESPAGTGAVDVTVTAAGGTSATSAADVFTYAATVTDLSQSSGPASGGTLVTITGTGFTGATAVNFGTTATTSFTVSSDSSLTVASPAGTGTVDVTVTTASGTSATSSGDQFTYSPTVTGISPAAGPLGGGKLVTITGTGFTGATLVDFGANNPAPTPLTFVSPTLIQVDSPPGVGVVDVTVTTPVGTSTRSPADLFTYEAAPTVTGLSPGVGSLAGGTLVTITGTGFVGAKTVDFGPNNPATDVTDVNATTITAYSPAGAGTGAVDVTVTAAGGTSSTSPADQFAYVAAPVLSSLSPASGPAAGGTTVAIIGTGFSAATAVDFGTTPAMDLTVVSENSITVESPAGTGTVDVTVTTPGGTSATSVSDRFAYGPTVSAISPPAGPLSGGTLVTITGTGFIAGATVVFGTMPPTIPTFIDATTIIVVSPPVTSAATTTVDVTVITANGTSPTSLADHFSYEAAPTVSGMSPQAGPLGGGTLVTITGTNFTGATVVDFGANPATNVTVVNDTTITADSPAGTAGNVPVSVIAPGGMSTTGSTAPEFTYLAVPIVAAVSPANGPAVGGTLVTITGSGFTDVTGVDFGTVPATVESVAGGITITAYAPAGTGAVDVTVTAAGGTSATSAADVFTYGPTISLLNPASGPLTGGTLVTITGTGFTTASAVDFGTTAAISFTIVNTTTITAVSPAGTGIVGVSVTTASGISAGSLNAEFAYVPTPTVSGISPSSGPAGGGTVVTITGTGFTETSVLGAVLPVVTAIEFGTTPAASFNVESATTIAVLSPAGVGTVNVTVTDPGGISSLSTTGQFTYTSPPTVSSVSPSEGPAAGGTMVTITGTGFTGATAVDFGTTPATSVSVMSSTSLMAENPPGTGNENVTVTTVGGTSATSPADQFTYPSVAPAVTSIDQVVGPLTGGTRITITGINLANVTAVEFGTTPAASIVSDSATQIVVVSPAVLSPGGVPVVVITSNGQASAPEPFSFVSSPTVSGVSPAKGPVTGGEWVTITGTSFMDLSAVDFGTIPAKNFMVENSTLIMAESSAGTGTGTVDVTVTNPAGKSAISAGDHFSYIVDGPQVSMTPSTSVHARSTIVIITFNGPLERGSAQNVSNYGVVGPTGQRIKVKSASYKSSSHTVTLVLAKRLVAGQTYRLTIFGTKPSGLRSPVGLLLDGAGNGTSGSNHVTMLTGAFWPDRPAADSQRPSLRREPRGLFFA